MNNHRKINRINRKKNIKTYEVPRCVIFKSSKHFYVNLIDDSTSKTIFSVSTLNLKIKNNKDAIDILSSNVIEFVKNNKIERVIFDKNGFLLKGNVKLLSDKLLENNLLRKKNK